jgi:RNA polymerase sigma-70 factor (ECF subfamily)
MTSELTDEALSRLARTNADAYSELYRRYVARIYRYHLARTGRVEDAEDLTAQTFLTALESICNYKGQAAFVSWLFGIASHKLADYYRRRKPTKSLEVVAELAENQPSLDDITDHRQRMRQVAKALESLAPERAEALVLRLFGGLNAVETGLVMGKSAAAVKMLVYRGLKDLRHRLYAGLETTHE